MSSFEGFSGIGKSQGQGREGDLDELYQTADRIKISVIQIIVTWFTASFSFKSEILAERIFSLLVMT